MNVTLRGPLLLAWLLIVIPLALAAGPAAAAEIPATEKAAAFDAYAARTMVDWQLPGMAVAVVHRGEVVLARGYGVREIGRPGAVDEDTLFAIGSTTKAMTAALLGQLVEEGKIGWDDPVSEHLPAFRLHDPYVTREVTVRDLLTHRAGLGNADLLWYGAERSWQEIFAKLRLVEPAYSLRAGYRYQNLMYATAGELSARVAQLPWPELAEERLFEPLGMTRTAATLGRAPEENRAAPHDRVGGEIVAIENAPVDVVAAAGAVWSSAADLARWLRMLLAEGTAADGTRVLAEETVAELLSPQTLVPPEAFYPTRQLTEPHWITYGLGWFQQDYRGLMVHFHTGSIDGMAAIVGLVPEHELGIAVLQNLDHSELRHALLWTAVDLFAGGAATPTEERDWSAELKELYDGQREQAEARRQEGLAGRIEGTSPSLPLATYAGAYAHPLYDEVQVAIEEGALRLQAGPGFTAPLEHWHHDTFLARWDRAWRGETFVTFVLDADGEVGELRLFGETFGRMVED